MYDLINADQFRELKNDPTKQTETKLQNLLRRLKINKYLSDQDYKRIYRNHQDRFYFMEQQAFANQKKMTPLRTYLQDQSYQM